MDPSYLITQVNSNNGQIENSELTAPGMGHDLIDLNASGEKIKSSINKSTSNNQFDLQAQSVSSHVSQTKSNNRVGSKSGSRFLSQLLCCFAIGHSPDYALHESQQQQQLLSEQELPGASFQQPSNELATACIESEGAPNSVAVDAVQQFLLPAPEADMSGRVCAVIDLDETLVHSSFKCNGASDFAIEVEVDNIVHQIYVQKRPHLEEFLVKMGQLFECVLFTASMGKYADPVSDIIDPGGAIKHRLFREACVYHCESYVKDLGSLGRPVDRCVIIDNSPVCYMFNPDNAIRVQTWTGEPDDTELRDLLPYMEGLARCLSVSCHLRDNPPPLRPPLSMGQLVAQMRQVEEDSDS